MKPALKVEQFCLKYPGSAKPLLADIDLTVQHGELIGVAGLSGAGKSSLVMAITGIIPHRISADVAGSIAVSGVQAGDMSLAQRGRLIGLVMQDADDQLFTMRVADDISFGLENMNLDLTEIDRRVDAALKKTGIMHLKDMQPSRLSGGEKHLACLACVMAMQPCLLVLDETLSDLDAETARSVLDVVKNFCRDGGACIMIEHNLKMLSECDRLYMLSDGNLNPSRIADIEDTYRNMLHTQGLEMI